MAEPFDPRKVSLLWIYYDKISESLCNIKVSGTDINKILMKQFRRDAWK